MIRGFLCICSHRILLVMMTMMMKLLLLVIIAIGTDDQGLPAHYFFLASIFKTNSLCLYPMEILDSKMLFCYFGTHIDSSLKNAFL